MLQSHLNVSLSEQIISFERKIISDMNSIAFLSLLLCDKNVNAFAGLKTAINPAL
jgi:hypothetical protein